MNKANTESSIAVMQAYVDGAEIEYQIGDKEWMLITNLHTPQWEWDARNYRVKPKPREFWINNSVDWKTGDLVHVVKGADSMIPGDRSKWIRVREVIE